MPTRIVTVAGSIERETEVTTQLERDPGFIVAFRCLERAEVLATLRAGAADLVLAVGVAPWFDFQCLEEARRCGVRLYGIAADPVEADMLEVRGFRVVRDLTHLKELVTGDLPPQDQPEPHETGNVVAVWGPKGSPGRTTIAIELATVLAQSEPATLLVDADLYGGDIAQLLGVVEELPGIVPLCRLAARGGLRDRAWVTELGSVDQGPTVLPGLLRAELWREVSAFGWNELVDAAREAFSTTVIDVGFCVEPPPALPGASGRNDVAISALEKADRILVVVRADPIGLRSFFWSFTDHRDLFDEERCVVVLNRVRPGDEEELRKLVRRHLGSPPFALIPDRPDHAVRAVWQGLPMAISSPSSPVHSAMRDVAAGLGTAVAADGFLTRLIGRHAGV
jgi:MinD-like ATPase involved in chromosome partitioning or flagellar assembly